MLKELNGDSWSIVNLTQAMIMSAIALFFKHRLLENRYRDFPGGPMVKNPPCKASSPVRGTKIPHAMEQLSFSATTTEPEHHK